MIRRALSPTLAVTTLALAASAVAFVMPSPSVAQALPAGIVADDGSIDPEAFSALDYRLIGPTRGGRVTTVAGHPSHPSTFYMGATGGGVWKTEDYGETWVPISDGYFETGSIGAIRVAPSNPNVVYVGTGSDGIRSNVIVGRGIYKSTDAGATWTFLGLRDAGQIGAVEVHPTNPDLVYVAALGNPFGRNTERGVFRSRDGGTTWDKVLFASDSVGAIDLEIHPSNPDVIYAAMWRGERKPWTIISGCGPQCGNGFYRSADGGTTWTRVRTGLPQGLTGKMDIAVSADDPDRVYLLVETLPEEEGLYRSDDAGRSFRLVNNQDGLMDRPFYYTNVEAAPSDADLVYVLSTGAFRSRDAGASFERFSTPHGDNHDIWINPSDPDLFIQSNDGGANVTRDGGRSWSTQNNQPTAELYQVDVDTRFPYWLYAGQQDNSTVSIPSNPPPNGLPDGIESVGGCETGPAVPKPGDPNVVFANCKGRFGRYSRITGDEQQFYVGAANMYGTNPKDLPHRFQRTVPIEVSPHNPDKVYHGSQYVNVTLNGGETWEQISPDLTAFRPERQVISGEPITRDITGEEHYSTLYVIEESPVREGVIWTGANDGPVQVTQDGGRTWSDVTPPDMPPEGRIQNIDPSPHDPARAYVAGYRYLLGDFRPYIYKTEDYGESWTLLTDGTNGIPADYPTRVVREDEQVPGLLYAGTEFGIYVSFDDGESWQSLQLDLPVTPVTDIEVVESDLAISTMGRSFWVLDDVAPLRTIARALRATTPPNGGAQAVEALLYQPSDAYRTRGGGRGGFGRGGRGGGPDGPPIRPEYESGGAYIDFWLSEAPTQPVTLEFLDARGTVVAGIRSGTGGYTYETVQEMRAPEVVRRGGPRFDVSQGHNRFAWDYRYRDTGLLLPPGEYAVRLSIGDRAVGQRSFRLLLDPNSARDGITVADLEEQFAFNLRMEAFGEEAQAVADQVDEALERARSLAEGTGASAQRARQAVPELEALRSQFYDERGISYPQPMFLNQVRYLANMTSGADQPPGNQAHQRYAELRAQLDQLTAELEAIVAAAGIG